MSDPTRTVRMPTAYLADKLVAIGGMSHTILDFEGRIADVPDWWLREVAETAQAIVDEVDRWRAEAGKEGA